MLGLMNPWQPLLAPPLDLGPDLASDDPAVWKSPMKRPRELGRPREFDLELITELTEVKKVC